MLKSAYVHEFYAYPHRKLNWMLGRSTKRLDPFPYWCEMMWVKGRARAVYMQRCKNARSGNLTFSSCGADTDSFWLAKWRDDTPKASVNKLFDAVRKYGGTFLCVNDDWMLDQQAYLKEISPFWRWLAESFPERKPWELDEPTAVQQQSMCFGTK